MSVEKAKEFLVVLADDDEAAARIDAAYLAALRAESEAQGFELSDDDLAVALAEMTGLGDTEPDEVNGYFNDTWLFSGSKSLRFGNPLGFAPRRFGS
ncbi:MAG TPA: hypothetical protein VK866_05345 [Acidimicrobiales bacterium]|nr:hypothetical protein [Acidimicrobiales bacterium]